MSSVAFVLLMVLEYVHSTPKRNNDVCNFMTLPVNIYAVILFLSYTVELLPQRGEKAWNGFVSTDPGAQQSYVYVELCTNFVGLIRYDGYGLVVSTLRVEGENVTRRQEWSFFDRSIDRSGIVGSLQRLMCLRCFDR